MPRHPGCARSVIGLVFLATAALYGSGACARERDPVVFSFATVGDSRQDPVKPDPDTLLAVNSATGAGGPNRTGILLPQDQEYLQNSQAWPRIRQGIESQGAKLLFFNGDMVYGYGRPTLPGAWANGQPSSWTTSQLVSPDAFFEYVQYAYWRGLIASLFSSGTYVVPVAGNHESQCNSNAAPYSSKSPNPNCAHGKTAYADNENAFRANTSDLVTDLLTNLRFSKVTGFNALNVSGLTQATAPTASADNGNITSDQSLLSYSFDIQPAPGLLLHFAVINTDPAGADSTAPTGWLAADFAAAKGRAAAGGNKVKFFVFGHKAAFTYNYGEASGENVGAGGLDANENPGLVRAFWSLIAQYGATYFCGHEHTVNVSRHADPTGTYPGTPYQVIVGSGGSPFDAKLDGACPSCSEPKLTHPYDRYYAWALARVHRSGTVSLSVRGFSDTFGPTRDLVQYDVAKLQ